MKRFFLFLFASLLSISMFAQNDGSTKAKAIPYNWNTGIVVTSEPNVGKWYVVNLDKTNGGIFYDKEYVQAHGMDSKWIGKTANGDTEANIKVVNPLNEKVEVDITAYIAANEYNHHYTLQAVESKAMNLGAGMLVKMGNYQVYLYLVMDVKITPEQAAAMDAVQVNIEPAPANSEAFVPVAFDWTGIGVDLPSNGNIIPANKEVWLKVDWNAHVTYGNTLKLCARTTNGAPTTVYGGLAMDCPATSIQEQSTELSLNEIAHKTLDLAMLDMVPGTVYVRLKASQELHVWAVEVEPQLPDEPIFTIDGATEIVKGQTYTLSASSKYFVKYATLTAPEYYYTQIELTNTGAEVTLQGKAAKNAQDLPGGKVYSAMSQDVTIEAGTPTNPKVMRKEIDNTIMKSLVSGDQVYGLVTGGNSNISFKLVEVCTEKDPCVPANAELVTIPATGEVSRAQDANTTKWYKVAVKAAKTAQTDIRMTLEADDEVTFNVDIAADCAIGEPTQSYNGTSSSSSYTIGYALFENAGDTLYVRVNCNKDMTVKAKLIAVSDDIVWSGSEWSNGIGPKKDKPAYIDAPLTISGKVIEASQVVLRNSGSILIKQGGALFVGVGGLENNDANRIVVEDGGMLLIDPTSSVKVPYITAHKTLHLGQQEAYSKLDTDPYKATLPDLHEFITVPVSQPEDLNARCLSWDRVAGWKNKKKISEFGPNVACEPFIGYNIYTKDGEANYGDYDAVFSGKLASNKNQSFVTSQIGWYAFGNAWFAPIKLSYLLEALDGAYASTGSTGEANQKAVHTYVTTPMDIQDLDEAIIKDNYYIPLTAEIAANVGISEIKPMQGFFLFTEEGCNISVDYTKVWNDATGYGNTPNQAPKRAAADDRNKAAVVLRGGNNSDFVYMIEGSATNASKMVDANLAIYAENGLGQVAKDNLIGTILTIKTNNATEYTLSFGWLNGETMYLRDLQNGVLIEMTEDNKYTFTAEPNTTAERFQVVGRNNVVTGVENSKCVEGANKFIENGNVVIIKNGVKYNVLGAQL